MTDDPVGPEGPPEPPAAEAEPAPTVPEPAPEPGPPPLDEPILPPAYDEAGLQDAVGAKHGAEARRRTRLRDARDDRDRDDDDVRPKTSRRTLAIAAGSVLVGLTAAALVFLGRSNAERFMITCAADHVSAEQGRGFPPWGSHPLGGPEWKAIALPTNAECKPRETDDVDELGKWYLDALLERANLALTGKNLLESIPTGGATTPNPLDIVAAQLDQALLLARSPDRRDQRKEIERLQGDVQYWRASARLREATVIVLDAAKQFETAAAQRPRHAADADAWATFLKKTADQLRGGPNAPVAAAQPTAEEPHPTAPMGGALPVEAAPPEAGSATAPPPAPDAGVPTGGVLL